MRMVLGTNMQFFNSVMVQYHALGVLYHIKKSDRLAVSKLVTKLTKSHMKSPFAVSLLVCSIILTFLL